MGVCLAGRSSQLDEALVNLLVGNRKKWEKVDFLAKLAAVGLAAFFEPES